MILPIVQYGHQALRQKGAEIHQVTDAVRQLAKDMIETMHAANGLGLAAQQVGKALQLTVLDARKSDRPSQLFLGVREMPLDSMMPLVLLNPKITRQEGGEIGQEGCLSFPKIYLDISRAHTIHVTAMGLDGRSLQFVATGLLSRAIQHEMDHLQGVLFIDKVTPAALEPLESDLQKLKTQTLAELKKKKRKKAKG